MVIPKSNSNTKPTTSAQSSSSKKTSTSVSKSKESSSAKPEKSTTPVAPPTSESIAKPEEPAKPHVDMKPAITTLFTAFQEYNTETDSIQSRADKMKTVATDDTVSSLLPNNSDSGKDSASIAAAYKFIKPIDIIEDANVAGNYAVVMNYSVTVMGNSTKYTDTYIVGTEGDKITSVSKRSSTMDD